METIEISGGYPLVGSVAVQGSKNAILPMIAASILTEEKVVLKNCPHIDDAYTMLQLVSELGCKVSFENHVIEIESGKDIVCEIKQDTAKKVRASITLLGSLIGRCKKAKLPYPGGCTIGARPINLHIEMLKKLGVSFKEEECYVEATASSLSGADIKFHKKSVGASQNCIMAAVLSDGITRIKGIALEPEVMELCTLLRKMGAVILRTDYDELMIKGVDKLHGVTYTVPADRIVAGTYLMAAVATRGEIYLENAPVKHLNSVIKLLKKMDATVVCKKNGIYINGKNASNGVEFVSTDNYPGFPTDLQSQLVAALAVANGKSIIEEKIFESRFKAVVQLNKMGADIKISGKKIIITPVSRLCGKCVVAEELRGGAALVIAGLVADGTTIISNCHYIMRGYEDIVKDFKALGAHIETIGEQYGDKKHDGKEMENKTGEEEKQN